MRGLEGNRDLRKENVGQYITGIVTMKEKLKYGLLNLRGKKYGDLLVLKRVQNQRKWKVQCTREGCGKIITVSHVRLIGKEPKTNCGCAKIKGVSTKHKKEYHCWWDAKNRCHNENHPSYSRYGAKGVRMCEQWQNSFEQFFKDVGKAPEGMSLDRIDAHGHYEPKNVRWATDLEQARNKKNTKYVKHPTTGQPIAAAALADELKMTYQQLRTKMIYEGTWEKV